MTTVVYRKRRRLRHDPGNPYRSRVFVYSIIEDKVPGDYQIQAEQYEYVLKNQVAYAKQITQPLQCLNTAKQLVEYMLKRVASLSEVSPVIRQWQEGRLKLVSETSNLLVKEALRRRFARNLRKL